MADLLWQDVVEVSRSQAKQFLLEMLDDVGFGATSWQDGSVASICVEIGAEILSRGSRIAVFTKTVFLPGVAKSEALTRLSRGFFDNERETALEAQHLVTLTCATGAGPHTINIGDVVLVYADGQTFRNIAGNGVTYPFSLSSSTPLTALFEAETTGAAGNIVSGSGTTVQLALDTTLAGVTVTSHTLSRAGVNEESDDRLDERNATKWSTLEEGEGTDELVENLALEASASIVHVAVDSSNPRGAGTFDVYLAGLDATASDDDVAKAQAAISRRFFGLNDSPAACLVKKSPTVDVAIVGTVYYSGSSSQSDVVAAVDAALLEYLRATPSGGHDYSPGPKGVIRVNDLETVIKNAKVGDSSPVRTVTLTTPAADLSIPLYGRPVRPTGGFALVYQATSIG